MTEAFDYICNRCYRFLYHNATSRWPVKQFFRNTAFSLFNIKYKTIKLHVSNSCNLKCKNCYCDFSSNQSISRDDIFKLFDQLKPVNNNFNLHILGGEPLLRVDICDIIRRARRKIREVILFTNATLISADKAAEIRRAGVSAVIVTLHSSYRDVHDTMTQTASSWGKTVEGIKNLVAAGLPTYTFTVLMDANSGHLNEIESFVKGLGAKTMYFPYIRQRKTDNIGITDKEQFQSAINWVFNKSQQYQKKLISILRKRPKACSAFVSTININADGAVTPCPFLNLELGNIKEEKFYKILHRGGKNKQLLEFLSIPGECMQCSLVNICGGGCKAFRFNKYMDTFSKDANCQGPYREKIPSGELGRYLPYIF